MRARTRDAVEMHDCRTRCRRDVADVADGCRQFIDGVCASKPAGSSNYAVRESGACHLTQPRSTVAALHV